MLATRLAKVEAWKRQGVSLASIDCGTDPVSDNGLGKLFFNIYFGERREVRAPAGAADCYCLTPWGMPNLPRYSDHPIGLRP